MDAYLLFTMHGTYNNSSELPDSRSLRNRLEWKLEMEGLSISIDSTNLLNNGLNEFLKRFIKPSMELAKSRCGHDHLKQVNDRLITSLNGMQRSTQIIYASLLDFQVAMELNPHIIGEDWPAQLEKVCLRASEE
ncbi:hypothetical protein HHK36_008657 [Tetracentron sinense]|uniref:Uncharacterized protein n=1 Tax=Tetracentron sinense TaxID=13715 RepID=A0A834ZFV5_TETSI|nr:hypothetical protein HHK36_008657 [Tetracentron sinense]